MFDRIKKRFERRTEYVPVFHGTDRELRPEQFDFDMMKEDSDFGRAAYFGLRYKEAERWASYKDHGVVNWYLFYTGDAERNSEIKVRYFDTAEEWVDTILRFYEHSYCGNEDIIIGDTMDAKTGRILMKYKRLADQRHIPIYELDSEIKMQIISELKPERYDQQIAIRTRNGLKYLEFIDSHEVGNMADTNERDPVEIAADVAELISLKDGIPQNEAIVRFMRSATFHRILDDSDTVSKDIYELLDMYRREAGRRTGEISRTTISW